MRRGLKTQLFGCVVSHLTAFFAKSSPWVQTMKKVFNHVSLIRGGQQTSQQTNAGHGVLIKRRSKLMQTDIPVSSPQIPDVSPTLLRWLLPTLLREYCLLTSKSSAFCIFQLPQLFLSLQKKKSGFHVFADHLVLTNRVHFYFRRT